MSVSLYRRIVTPDHRRILEMNAAPESLMSIGSLWWGMNAHRISQDAIAQFPVEMRERMKTELAAQAQRHGRFVADGKMNLTDDQLRAWVQTYEPVPTIYSPVPLEAVVRVLNSFGEGDPIDLDSRSALLLKGIDRPIVGSMCIGRLDVDKDQFDEIWGFGVDDIKFNCLKDLSVRTLGLEFPHLGKIREKCPNLRRCKIWCLLHHTVSASELAHLARIDTLEELYLRNINLPYDDPLERLSEDLSGSAARLREMTLCNVDLDAQCLLVDLSRETLERLIVETDTLSDKGSPPRWRIRSVSFETAIREPPSDYVQHFDRLMSDIEGDLTNMGKDVCSESERLLERLSGFSLTSASIPKCLLHISAHGPDSTTVYLQVCGLSRQVYVRKKSLSGASDPTPIKETAKSLIGTFILAIVDANDPVDYDAFVRTPKFYAVLREIQSRLPSLDRVKLMSAFQRSYPLEIAHPNVTKVTLTYGCMSSIAIHALNNCPRLLKLRVVERNPADSVDYKLLLAAIQNHPVSCDIRGLDTEGTCGFLRLPPPRPTAT